MQEKSVYYRTREEYQKVIEEQGKGFKKIHKLLQDKTNLVCNLRKEIVELKGKIKELEIEIKRLRND